MNIKDIDFDYPVFITCITTILFDKVPECNLILITFLLFTFAFMIFYPTLLSGLCYIIKWTFLWRLPCFRLPVGSLMEIAKFYPLDADFDNPDHVPGDISSIEKYHNEWLKHSKSPIIYLYWYMLLYSVCVGQTGTICPWIDTATIFCC